MKYGNWEEKIWLLSVGIFTAFFVALDAHVARAPSWLLWVVFFPLLVTRNVGQTAHLGPDHLVLFQAIMGFPLQIIYFFGLLSGLGFLGKKMTQLSRR